MNELQNKIKSSAERRHELKLQLENTTKELQAEENKILNLKKQLLDILLTDRYGAEYKIYLITHEYTFGQEHWTVYERKVFPRTTSFSELQEYVDQENLKILKKTWKPVGTERRYSWKQITIEQLGVLNVTTLLEQLAQLPSCCGTSMKTV